VDQPYHRHLSRTSTGADSNAAFDGPGRHSHAVAAAEGERTGPLSCDGNTGTQRSHQEPYSRRQDSPDLFDDANGSGKIWHADFQSVSYHSVLQEADHSGDGSIGLVQR